MKISSRGYAIVAALLVAASFVNEARGQCRPPTASDLANRLVIDARLPDGVDKIPIRKEYEWKHGFSFTYRFPLKSRTEETQ